MKLLACSKCGSSDFFEQNGYRICSFCRSKYAIQSEEIIPPNTTIAVNDDVTRLLQKCRADPSNARKYASLILDIDPGNAEAKRLNQENLDGYFDFKKVLKNWFDRFFID